MSSFAAKITGIGSAFPETRLTNFDLAKDIDTSDEWIRERTGIVERRVSVRGKSEDTNSSLGYRASLQALEMAGKKVSDVDAIFYATCTGDTLIPSTASWLQHKLGAKRAWGVDLNAACSGFVYGLTTANAFIKSGQVKTALVVGTDLTTAFTNWDDRSSCILFGDGSGAAVVEQTDESSSSKIISSTLGTDGDLWDLFHIPAGGSNMETTGVAHDQKLDKMHMKGREIFKVAVRTLADYAVNELEKNGYTAEDLDWIVPHQANLRIIEAVAKRLNFPMSKVLVNIDRHGNTSAATVPTALDEAVRSGKVKKGQLVLLDVFGAGLTFGSMLLRW